jgi:hypothetical protein
MSRWPAAAGSGRTPAGVYERWAEFTDWAASATCPTRAVHARPLGSPSPAPRQVFGIGLNYSAHAAESGLRQAGHGPAGVHEVPLLHHRPYTDITLPPGGHTDWEVELVVIIGRRRGHVAGRRRLGPRGRPVHRPGRLRADPADGLDAAAVQPGQVLSRASGRSARTWSRRMSSTTRTTWNWLLDQRRADAEGPHQRADLRRARADRAAVPGHPAAARRPHLHRHAVRAWA